MKDWWKRLSSAALAAILTFQLNGRAYAQEQTGTTEDNPPQL